MTEILINALSNPNCTVQAIKLILESQDNMRIILNEEIDGLTPLCVALVNRESVDIIKTLLNFGADANHACRSVTPLSIAFNYGSYSVSESQYCGILEVLLNYGANINGDTSPVKPFLYLKSNFKSSNFMPVIKAIAKYADKITKTSALSLVLQTALDFDDGSHYDDETRVLPNSIQAVKLLLECNADPPQETISDFIHIATQLTLRNFSDKISQLILQLFEIIVPYFLLNKCIEQTLIPNENIDLTENSYIDEWECINPDQNNKLLFELKNSWNMCLQERNKMQFDTLSNDTSLHQILKDWCQSKENSKEVNYETLYEIMLRFALEEYPHFKDIMRLFVKNYDFMKLYDRILKEHLNNIYLLPLENFLLVQKYLSKEDIFHYLIALLPKKI